MNSVAELRWPGIIVKPSVGSKQGWADLFFLYECEFVLQMFINWKLITITLKTERGNVRISELIRKMDRKNKYTNLESRKENSRYKIKINLSTAYTFNNLYKSL